MTRLHLRVLIVGVLLVISQFSLADSFPKNPDSILTPGDLCAHPNSQRYAERINYCDRNVRSDTKDEIIRTYDRERGFNIGKMKRDAFKIDHYIPLCMGGSNDRDNLWPQHESVFTITDPLEATLCEKMKEGRILQRDAIVFIKRAKNNLQEADLILKQVMAM